MGLENPGVIHPEASVETWSKPARAASLGLGTEDKSTLRGLPGLDPGLGRSDPGVRGRGVGDPWGEFKVKGLRTIKGVLARDGLMGVCALDVRPVGSPYTASKNVCAENNWASEASAAASEASITGVMLPSSVLIVGSRERKITSSAIWVIPRSVLDPRMVWLCI